MTTLYILQFFVFSTCVYIFTLFTYYVFYTDVISTMYFHEIQTEYDYIIVGCGTAGSVIAHRLATETNFSFVVLEAGSKSHTLLEAPILGPFLHGSLFDWQYQTVPQENACLGMKDQKCKLAQGKVVGGSSKLNNMIHVRGNITHYSDWFNGKYTEEYIRQQFQYVENNVVKLSNLSYISTFSNAVLDATKELGYDYVGLDFKKGFMKSIVSQENGKRWATSDMLELSKSVISNILVEKVLFIGNKATGVKCLIGNKEKTIFARKGIIISAGAINSPKILQLSGIGPKVLLESLNIPIIEDLPVGKNLQDHIGTGLDFVLFNDSLSITPMDMINPYHVLQYLFLGKGPWTTPGCEIVGFVSTKKDSDPDILLMVLPVGLSSDRGSLLKNNVNIDDKVFDNYFSKIYEYHAATIMPIILHPKSKGEVFINTTDPRQPPLLNPKYFSHKDDRETLINGLKLVIKLINTEAIKKVGGFVNPFHFPGCEGAEIFTDEYFECYIKHLTLTSYHPIGTCSIGPPNSEHSVVDTSFKVLGLEGLYIVDASVLPTMPSGNINAAVAMMASLFFETNIADRRKYPLCFKNDFMKEYISRICLPT